MKKKKRSPKTAVIAQNDPSSFCGNLIATSSNSKPKRRLQQTITAMSFKNQ